MPSHRLAPGAAQDLEAALLNQLVERGQQAARREAVRRGRRWSSAGWAAVVGTGIFAVLVCLPWFESIWIVGTWHLGFVAGIGVTAKAFTTGSRVRDSWRRLSRGAFLDLGVASAGGIGGVHVAAALGSVLQGETSAHLDGHQVSSDARTTLTQLAAEGYDGTLDELIATVRALA